MPIGTCQGRCEMLLGPMHPLYCASCQVYLKQRYRETAQAPAPQWCRQCHMSLAERGWWDDSYRALQTFYARLFDARATADHDARLAETFRRGRAMDER